MSPSVQKYLKLKRKTLTSSLMDFIFCCNHYQKTFIMEIRVTFISVIEHLPGYVTSAIHRNLLK